MISIIMSAYNAEKTIKKAIISVLNQKYKNFELIIINDCSTDNTLNIINQFKDNRIRVINNKYNLGAGMSRRIGVENITGNYTLMLDSDDYLSKDCLSTLMSYTKYNADIIIPGCIIEDEKYNTIKIKKSEFKIEKDDDKFKPNKEDTKRFLNCMLVNSKLWDKVVYSHRRYIEDTPTLYKLMFFANKVINIPYAGYHYVQNSSSLCHTSSKLKHAIYTTLVAKDLIEFRKQQGVEYDDDVFIYRLEELKKFNLDELYLYKDEVLEIFKYILKDN